MGPELLDIIELLGEVPEHGLHSGNQEVIVRNFRDQVSTWLVRIRSTLRRKSSFHFLAATTKCP